MINIKISPAEDGESGEERCGKFDESASLVIPKETLSKIPEDRYLLMFDDYENWKIGNQKSLSKFFLQLSERASESSKMF